MNSQANTPALAIVQNEIDARAYWVEKSEQFFVHIPTEFGGYESVVAQLYMGGDAFGRYAWVVDVTGDEDRLVRAIDL